MKYDFTTILQRQDAIAAEHIPIPNVTVREGFSRIPMWVADMSFATAPSIPEAIIRRAEHPTYGYFSPTDAYYNAILTWQRERNGVQGLEREHIGYANGVLGGVMAAMSVLCSQGDSVLLHSPTYIGFTQVLRSSGYHIVHSPLQDLQPGGPGGQLLHHLRRLAPGADGPGGGPEPLQQHERAVHARPHRRLQPGGRGLAGGAAGGALGERPLGLRLYRGALPGRGGRPAPGDLYALPGLRRVAGAQGPDP